MPPLKVQHVVSCSSEDKVHNAENLLVSDHYRKWKSAEVGEKQVAVVLQLEKASIIYSIDIGNEGSAFVEVLVGRSSDSNPSYEVLLVSSSFMTPAESRQGTNTNRVRMFGSDKLSLAVSKEKWDLIKIVCTQPFNRTIQYGLSFIVFHSPPIKSEVEDSSKDIQTKIGAFTIKSADEKDNNISVGSWFAKRKSDSQDIDTQSSVSAIKSATVKTPSDTRSAPIKRPKLSMGESDKPKMNSTNGTATTSDKDKSNHNIKTASSESTKNSPKGNFQTSKSHTPNTSKKSSTSFKSTDVKTDQKTGHKTVAQSSSNSSSHSKKLAKNTRPFHKILEGTVFVLSGYQNPQRGQIRDKAVEMGAVYKTDWDKRCTHLICAFLNTPKFQEVNQKRGRIVTEKWILECYKQKKLLPWRQFLLGKTNRPITSESDCSTTEDESNETQPQSSSAKKQISKSDSEKRDPISAHKTVSTKSPNKSMSRSSFDKDLNPVPISKAETSRVRPISRSPTESQDEASDAVYEADTDVDTDSGCDTESEIRKVLVKNKRKEDAKNSKPDTSKMDLPPLPDIFKGEHFFLYGAFDDAEKKDLHRYIIGGGGVIEEYMNDEVSSVLTHMKWNQDFTNAIRDKPLVRILKPFWITKSIQCGKLLPRREYFVMKT